MPAQHGQLMAQDEDLRVLRRAAAGDQAESTHRPTQDQVQQSERHEPAIMPDALRQRTARSDRMDDILGTHRRRTDLSPSRGRPASSGTMAPDW